MTENPFPRNLEGKERLLYEGLRGVIIPLVTPFLPNPKTPKVDVESYSNLVSHTLPHVNALFTTGNAGEGPYLDLDNWIAATKTAVEVRNKESKKHIPVISGVLAPNPSDVAKFSAQAEKIGVDALVVVPMYGDKPEMTLQATLGSSSLPVILYNNPRLSDGKELPLDFVRLMVDNSPRVLGIKSSSTNFDVFRKTLAMKSDTFRVFQGNTEDAARSLKLGADGIVPVEACIDPILFANLYQVYLSNNAFLQDRIRHKVSDFLFGVKDKQLALNMGTARYIKTYLVSRNIFKSSRMYRQ